MLFIEPFFLVLFFPLVLGSLWQLSRELRREVGLGPLLLCSVLFYLRFGVGYCLLLLTSIYINFFVGTYLCGSESRASSGTWLWRSGVTCNFGALFYVKYLGSLGAAFASAGLSSSTERGVEHKLMNEFSGLGRP